MQKKTLLAIGEALIDFIPGQVGCAFSDVTSFSPQIGGAPANVCAAFTRLGGQSTLLTQLGNDPFGHKIADGLSEVGVNVAHIPFTDAANTSLAFVSLEADGNRTFSFYRNPSADMLYAPENVKEAWFQDAFALHFCSVALVPSPMREAHRRAIALAQQAGAIVSFDPNLRFPLWKDQQALKETVWEFLPQADILKLSDEELEFLTGETRIEAALPQLMCGNVQLVLYTCGKDGAWCYTKDGGTFAPAMQVAAKDTTGAGDGFIGAFLFCLSELNVDSKELGTISEDKLRQILEFCNRFCGFSVQRSGAISSYPSLCELKEE